MVIIYTAIVQKITNEPKFWGMHRDRVTKVTLSLNTIFPVNNHYIADIRLGNTSGNIWVTEGNAKR